MTANKLLLLTDISTLSDLDVLAHVISVVDWPCNGVSKEENKFGHMHVNSDWQQSSITTHLSARNSISTGSL